ncbi:MAG: hypothetical protein CM15mP59_1710 [Flavobacteriaceae bacterium]|nr:MAG: hypothetical protein CM15mP59_1710 [Flavobacteriaceae bacterium]
MENNKAMGEWLHAFDPPHPLVIAGPCSAERGSQGDGYRTSTEG